MKTYFFILISLFILQSCVTTQIQREVYEVEKYPMEWVDTICFGPEHFHFYDYDNTWRCVYSEADTFCLHLQDTIVVKKLVSVETYQVRKKKD